MQYLNNTIQLIKKYKIKNQKDFLIKTKQLHKIIKENALIFADKKTDIYSNFRPGDSWIFDFRKIFLNPDYINLCNSIFYDIFSKQDMFQVASLEIGGIPLVSSIITTSHNYNKNIDGLIIRKSRKRSGLCKNIEGNINNDKNVIIVDDLVNSGKSTKYVIELLKDEGYKNFQIFCLVKFRKELTEIDGIPITFIYDLTDFDVKLGNNDEYFSRFLESKKELIFSLPGANLTLDVQKSSPAFQNNKIYIGGEGGDFYCITNKGEIIWKKSVIKNKFQKNILSSPKIIGDKIVFGAYDGNLYILDKNNGKISNINLDADWIGSSPDYSPKLNMIYIGLEINGSYKGSLSAIDIKNGHMIWHIDMKDYIHCSPLYIEDIDLVICGTNGGEIFAVKSGNGEIIWKHKIKDAIRSGFRYQGNRLFFGSFDGYFYCINTNSGKLIWKFNSGDPIYSYPLVVGKNIFFGSIDNNFYHLNINGELLFKYNTNGKIFSSPIFIEKNIIAFASNDCNIYFYDFKKMEILYQFQHTERIHTTMYFDNKTRKLYFYDFKNNLWMIKI